MMKPLIQRRLSIAVRIAWCCCFVFVTSAPAFLFVEAAAAASASISSGNSGPWSVKATPQCHDTKPPTVTCPTNTTLYGSSPVLPNVVIYRIPVEDDCMGVSIKSQVPRPGSHLSPSVKPYNVTITVMDRTNKTGSCRWSVLVPPIATSAFVRAKVRAARNQVTWVPSTTVARRRISHGGYVAGISVKVARNGRLRRMPSPILRFYAYSKLGGRTELLKFRCNATAAARSARGKRLYLSHPVPFGVDEGAVTVRMVAPLASSSRRGLGTSNATATTASRLVRSAVEEVRVALLMQMHP